MSLMCLINAFLTWIFFLSNIPRWQAPIRMKMVERATSAYRAFMKDPLSRECRDEVIRVTSHRFCSKKHIICKVVPILAKQVFIVYHIAIYMRISYDSLIHYLIHYFVMSIHLFKTSLLSSSLLFSPLLSLLSPLSSPLSPLSLTHRGRVLGASPGPIELTLSDSISESPSLRVSYGLR